MTSSALARPPVSPPPIVSGPQRLVRVLAAVAIVGGPLGYLLGGVLEPAAHADGRVTIAANSAANPATNTIHLAAFMVASFLLPVGVVALAWLAHRRAPWLATIGGIFGVVGWLPFAALTALDDLAVAMARAPQGGSYATLWDGFAYDAVMNSYLIVYILAHLVAYVLLGIALHRARVIPAWAAASMIASSPVLIAAFVLPGQLEPAGLAVAAASVVLLILASLPAAYALAFPSRVGNRIRREP